MYSVQKEFLNYVAPENPQQVNLNIEDDEGLEDDFIYIAKTKKTGMHIYQLYLINIETDKNLNQEVKISSKAAKKKAKKEAKKKEEEEEAAAAAAEAATAAAAKASQVEEKSKLNKKAAKKEQEKKQVEKRNGKKVEIEEELDEEDWEDHDDGEEEEEQQEEEGIERLVNKLTRQQKKDQVALKKDHIIDAKGEKQHEKQKEGKNAKKDLLNKR